MRAAAALLALCATACGGETDRLGLQAWLRIPGAQYIAGALPQPSGGPEVHQAFASRTDIAPGMQDRSLHGSVDLTAAGIAVGLDGDAGYWVLPAGPRDAQEPDALTLDAALVFSPQLPSGHFDLIVQAVSPSGSAGKGFVIPLETQDVPPATDALAITLSWDTEADLDLHVVDPGGTELYWNHIAADGGVLDFDSNQSCQLDGLRRERIAWVGNAPPGHYLVRVDTPSLCGAPTARWRLEAQSLGQVIARAQGQSIPADTRGTHAAGAGLLALELDLP